LNNSSVSGPLVEVNITELNYFSIDFQIINPLHIAAVPKRPDFIGRGVEEESDQRSHRSRVAGKAFQSDRQKSRNYFVGKLVFFFY
jgi:hypothetical protein